MPYPLEQAAADLGDRLGAKDETTGVAKSWFALTGQGLLQAMQEGKIRLAGFDNGLLIEVNGETWVLAHGPEAAKFLPRPA